jgi:lipid II:glycine glycyltransferase (peptidoglycan interpeptide bridge formation enzyme)
MSMTIKLQKIQEKEGSTSDGILSSRAWGEVFESSGRSLAVFSGDQAIAPFVLYHFKKFGKDIVIHPPFAASCGLRQVKEHAKPYTKNTELKRTLRTIASYLQNEYSDAYIDIALPTDIKDIQPFTSAGFKTDLGYTYLLDIGLSEKELLANFSSERRKNVKDALKKEPQIEKDYQDGQVIARVKSTLESSGLSYNYQYLERIINSDFCFTISTVSQGEVDAAAIVVYDSHRAYYIAGGTSKKPEKAGMSALVLWEAILEAKRLGIPTFDFCGSTVPSIEKFFRGFGGELSPYFRIRKNTVLPDMLKTAKKRFGL